MFCTFDSIQTSSYTYLEFKQKRTYNIPFSIKFSVLHTHTQFEIKDNREKIRIHFNFSTHMYYRKSCTKLNIYTVFRLIFFCSSISLPLSSSPSLSTFVSSILYSPATHTRHSRKINNKTSRNSNHDDQVFVMWKFLFRRVGIHGRTRRIEFRTLIIYQMDKMSCLC